jgi:hypothetical protein
MPKNKNKSQEVEVKEYDMTGVKFTDDGSCQHEYDSIDIGMRCTCLHVMWSLICKKCKHWKPDTVRNDLQHAESDDVQTN